MRRMVRHARHGGKNEHRFGGARSQTRNARASRDRRPCDVHERACDAARQTPSARSFAAIGLKIDACIPWLWCHERLHPAYEASLRSRGQELALDRHRRTRRATTAKRLKPCRQRRRVPSSEANAVSTKLCGLRIGNRCSHSVAPMPRATSCGVWSVTKVKEPRTRTRPAPHDQTCNDSQASEAVRSTTARAEQGGKRRQHEALRPSPWNSVLLFSGSDATSDSVRRMERHEGHAAKNSHWIGTAGSDVQRQPSV